MAEIAYVLQNLGKNKDVVSWIGLANNDRGQGFEAWDYEPNIHCLVQITGTRGIIHWITTLLPGPTIGKVQAKIPLLPIGDAQVNTFLPQRWRVRWLWPALVESDGTANVHLMLVQD